MGKTNWDRLKPLAVLKRFSFLQLIYILILKHWHIP